ncbi:MAG: toll/interleukin-1 receptor domain-containing protein [Pseudanabaenales cyanobacterium]|nr:toll/interleukin-1 receptor domain-containing protein [Pseudanabaenales cyanobacterium]
MSVEVFFSYAHKDEDLRDELAKHLSILKRQGVITAWYDRDIDAGREWAKEIDQHLNSAQIILLLISPDFMALDYCYDIELERAMKRHEAGEARVIPIILRPVDWSGAAFSKLQALPKNAQPITDWTSRDQAFMDAARGIRVAIEELETTQLKTKQQTSLKLYSALLKLGYRQQARLFRRAIESESVAAFLIHGLPEYGQRWLLNRLVVQYLPHSLNSKVVKVDLSRRVRRSDVSALWRELGGRVHLRGKQLSPPEIADRVYRWWLTQDVIFVFHDANIMPEAALHELINQFWLPLASKVKAASSQESDRKLLMFLVDYEGRAEKWNILFVEKLDVSWDPQKPIKPPRIQEFTDGELMAWLEDQYHDLPAELTYGIDDRVEEILANSEGGIPELAFREICDRCGVDWFEELETWQKL